MFYVFGKPQSMFHMYRFWNTEQVRSMYLTGLRLCMWGAFSTLAKYIL